MKKTILLLLICLLLAGCSVPEAAVETTVLPAAEETTLPETEAPTEERILPTETTVPPVVVELTEEDRELLLQIAMAELGPEECEECLALVMCTVLNRVESSRFSSTVRGVLYAQDQFTPVMDGSFDRAVPNAACYNALDMVIHGWDESKGALFYEFCEGESWHSKNLKLLTEHCNTRFYE